MFTKFKTIHKGKKDYWCYHCDKLIPIGKSHTYGVTTDNMITNLKNKIFTVRFCIDCIPLSNNEDQHKY